MMDDAVIRPTRPAGWADPPPLAFMIGSLSDMNAAVTRAGLPRKSSRNFLNSRLFYDPSGQPPFCIVGPFIGAPYAVILLETLVAWGVREIVFFGWCGSLHPDVRIGDLVVPSAAFSGEGTTPYYHPHFDPSGNSRTLPSERSNVILTALLRERRFAFHEGPVWTTDAVFRETPGLIGTYREKGALAVEMEASALFAVGACRGVAVSAILAVSDALHTLAWQPGFGDTRFRNTRKTIMDLIPGMAGKLQELFR